MIPLACNMTAFSADERVRYDALRAKVTAAIDQVVELPDGYRARLGRGMTSAEAAEWMSLEQRCCPFLKLGLRMEEGGAIWLELTGHPRMKEMLEHEFAVLRVSGPRTR